MGGGEDYIWMGIKGVDMTRVFQMRFQLFAYPKTAKIVTKGTATQGFRHFCRVADMYLKAPDREIIWRAAIFPFVNKRCHLDETEVCRLQMRKKIYLI